jgi:hypothetical protein
VFIHKTFIKLLKDLEAKNIDTVDPVLEAEIGYTYKGLPFHEFKEQLDLLTEMEKVDLVTRRKSTSVSVLCCARCNSIDFIPKLVCTMCGSSAFDVGSVIIHDDCKHLDFERKFESSAGNMICPKCRQELKSLGLDYTRISNVYECQNCKSTHQVAPEQYICLKCLNIHESQDLKIMQIHAYSLNKSRLSQFLKGDDFLNRISRDLLASGITCKTNANVKGNSNTIYEFPLAVYNGKESPFIVLDILRGQYVDEQEEYLKLSILSFFGKCSDMNLRNGILVTFTVLPDEIKSFGEAYGLKIIAGKSFAEVSSEIIRIISQLRSNNVT